MSEEQEQKAEPGALDDFEQTELPRDPLDLTLGVSWVVEEAPTQFTTQSFVTSVQLTWDELLLNFPLRAGESKNRTTLIKLFANALAARFQAAIKRQGYARPLRLRGNIEKAAFDHILNTLESGGYIQQTEKPRHIKQGQYWMLTRRGEDRMPILRTR